MEETNIQAQMPPTSTEQSAQSVAQTPVEKKKGGLLAWAIYAVIVAAAIVAWGSGFNWDFSNLNIYLFFPLLGLLAWSIMWSHYFLGALSHYSKAFKMSKFYKNMTGYKVLALILLHPGLLAFAQWQNGQGYPPSSYVEYVGSAMLLYIIFAEIALVTFLSFEVFRRVKTWPVVARNWRWVSLSQMVAMALIFAHSLKLGQNLQSGWFRYYWIMLGLLLIPSFIVVGKKDWQKKPVESAQQPPTNTI